MTSPTIDENAIVEAFRLDAPGPPAKKILNLQGLGLWNGDLADMRGDSPKRPNRQPVRSGRPTAAARRMMMLLRIKAALKQLPPRQRQLLHLYYYERLSTSQIAERVDLPVRLVEKSILRYTDHLRDIYLRKYADES